MKDILGIFSKRELGSVTKLNLSNNKISKIEGMEKLPNLRKLDLSNNRIPDITGLETLIDLVELNLEYNKIRKIDNLEVLSSLKNLYIFEGNDIAEVNKNTKSFLKRNEIITTRKLRKEKVKTVKPKK